MKTYDNFIFESNNIFDDYKVGDKVIIKKNLKQYNLDGIGVVSSMCDYEGKIATITYYFNREDRKYNRYRIDIDEGKYYWIAPMFEDANEDDDEFEYGFENEGNLFKPKINFDDALFAVIKSNEGLTVDSNFFKQEYPNFTFGFENNRFLLSSWETSIVRFNQKKIVMSRKEAIELGKELIKYYKIKNNRKLGFGKDAFINQFNFKLPTQEEKDLYWEKWILKYPIGSEENQYVLKYCNNIISNHLKNKYGEYFATLDFDLFESKKPSKEKETRNANNIDDKIYKNLMIVYRKIIVDLMKMKNRYVVYLSTQQNNIKQVESKSDGFYEITSKFRIYKRNNEEIESIGKYLQECPYIKNYKLEVEEENKQRKQFVGGKYHWVNYHDYYLVMTLEIHKDTFMLLDFEIFDSKFINFKKYIQMNEKL